MTASAGKPQHWLITGGCGFIGANLLRFLADRGLAFRVYDDLSVGSRDRLAGLGPFTEIEHGDLATAPWKGTQLVVGDIRDGDLLASATEGSDVFVHLAAETGVLPSLESPRADMEVNVGGTLNALLAARDAGTAHFVFASSGAPLGDQDPPLNEDTAPRPKSPYGASKLAGEGYASAFHGSFGLDTTALRFSNVYGPGSDHKASVVAKFIKLALARRPLVIYGDGGQTRDFIYIDDLLSAVELAASSDDGGHIYQIATGVETTVAELAALVASVILEETGLPTEIEKTESPPGEVRRSFADIAKARHQLGWEPAVRLEDGIRRTVQWFSRLPSED